MSEKQAPEFSLPTDWGIEVYRTQSDLVGIKHEGQFGDDEAVIAVSPERIEALISFLRAIKDEILTDRADRAEARNPHLGTPPFNG
ncbi:MAG TPA: hypothetical protein VGM77_02965 [Gemmatimonadales bacterium]